MLINDIVPADETYRVVKKGKFFLLQKKVSYTISSGPEVWSLVSTHDSKEDAIKTAELLLEKEEVVWTSKDDVRYREFIEKMKKHQEGVFELHGHPATTLPYYKIT